LFFVVDTDNDACCFIFLQWSGLVIFTSLDRGSNDSVEFLTVIVVFLNIGMFLSLLLMLSRECLNENRESEVGQTLIQIQSQVGHELRQKMKSFGKRLSLRRNDNNHNDVDDAEQGGNSGTIEMNEIPRGERQWSMPNNPVLEENLKLTRGTNRPTATVSSGERKVKDKNVLNNMSEHPNRRPKQLAL